jgi:hypothetical protein
MPASRVNPTCVDPEGHGTSCGPWVPALARELAPRAKRRAEARARPGHERVAADTMALWHLADASHRIVSYSPCQTAQFLHSRLVAASGFFSFLFSPSSLPTPERGDWRSAARRPALIRVAQVTRDATLARHGTSRATRRPASRRSTVALSAQVPPPSPLPGPARRLHATSRYGLAAVPGFSCPRLPAAVDATSRSAFRIVSGRRPS